MQKIKLLNLNTIVKILILFGFSAFFIYTVSQGTVTKYVHPRMIPIIIVASIVMFITAILLSLGIFNSGKDKKFNPSLIIYAVPILMAFCFPAVSFDSNTVSSDNFQFEIASSLQTETAESTSVDEKINADNDKDNFLETVTETTSSSELVTEKATVEKDSVVLDDSNYYSYLYLIYENPEEYVGKKIELTGFVFKDKSFSENEFVPARLVMVCCAADMVTSGFLCKYDNASELEADAWVKVTGTIQVKEDNGEITPYIEAISVENTDKPKQEYVYPY